MGVRLPAHRQVSESQPGAGGIAAQAHPVRFVVTDDLRRSRLTAFFRLLLAIPHLLWLTIWQYVFLVVIAWAWLVALLFGRLEEDLHSFVARYVRYMTHVYAYVFLLANPFPRFHGVAETYPVDVDIDGPRRQHRLKTLFRLVLAIPALIFTVVLTTVLELLAIAAWFVSLAIGRLPLGMRDLGTYCLRFQTQTYAYVCLLTDRYPSLASGTAPPLPAEVSEPERLADVPPPDGELIPPRSP